MKIVKFFSKFILLTLFVSLGFASKIETTDQYDLKMAIDYCNTANIDSIVLTTSGGVYTTTDTMPLVIKKPLAIVAKEGLKNKPILTHSDSHAAVLNLFQVCNDLKLDGITIDGGHERTHGLKHILRVGDHTNSSGGVIQAAKVGLNITVTNCDFVNIADKKIQYAEGHAVYFQKGVDAGTAKVENCTFKSIGDEAFRMGETEKYTITRCLDSLIVRNCTFSDIDAECVRFYGNIDTSDNADAYVLLEHLTVANSASRTIYIKNNKGTILRDIIIKDSRFSADRNDRNNYAVEIQLPGSKISCIDTLNMVFDGTEVKTIRATKGAVLDMNTFWGFDPKFADQAAGNYTLLPESHAYWSGHDGSALGDLRWAKNTPISLPFNLTVVGSGKVILDPPIEGRSYDPGTVVTLTAVPDSGYEFVGWSGSLIGTTNPITFVADASKEVTATFQPQTGIGAERIASIYRLDQNYPNPFNPTTKIAFSLKNDGFTTLEVFNLLGQRVATLENRRMTAGSHTVMFEAENLPTGIYYYKLKSGDFVSIKKMILMK